MQIYILSIDGLCYSKESNSIAEALKELYLEQFDPSDFDYEEFMNEVNMVEWKDLKNRYIKNYKNKKNPIEIFDLNSDFQLKNFLKVKPSKKPVKELEEEFNL